MTPTAAPLPPALYNSRFLRAARREPVDTTPVWLMRQAGRYLPSYKAVRDRVGSVLELCRRPDLAAEVTLRAQADLGVDAAILFADLPVILEPLGFRLTYEPGPTIHNPLRNLADLDRVRELRDPAELNDALETVRLVRAGLPADIPLIGFAGAPFTLASYAIEGGGSRSYVHTKRLMYADRGAWSALMERIAVSVGRYLNAQIDAGCQAVQLFDSWAGCLSPADYRRFVLPYTRRALEAVAARVPVIHFLTGNPALLPLCRDAGGDVIGLDWRVDLVAGWDAVGSDVAVQGNLDPVLLLADLDTLRKETEAMLRSVAGRPGHIFNLGHGVLPETPPQNARALVDIVHAWGSRR